MLATALAVELLVLLVLELLVLALLLPPEDATDPADPFPLQPVVRKATPTSIALISALAFTINTLPQPKSVRGVIERQGPCRGKLSV
jgi:hypothetical protein